MSTDAVIFGSAVLVALTGFTFAFSNLNGPAGLTDADARRIAREEAEAAVDRFDQEVGEAADKASAKNWDLLLDDIRKPVRPRETPAPALGQRQRSAVADNPEGNDG